MVFWRKLQQQRRASLEEGLALLNERLGLTPGTKTRTTATRIDVQPTEQHARNLYYGPDMDGNAEPGEVVWALVPSTPPEERAMLVVGRDHHDVLALLIHCGEEPVTGTPPASPAGCAWTYCLSCRRQVSTGEAPPSPLGASIAWRTDCATPTTGPNKPATCPVSRGGVS